MDRAWIVLIIMTIAGAVGGLTNHFISDRKEDKRLRWWQQVVIGIAAAFMIPLFLNTISSGLISEILSRTTKGPDVVSKILILAGFCLVAAVSSRAFIGSLSSKIQNQIESVETEAKEAKQQAAEVKATIEPLIETEASEELAQGFMHRGRAHAGITLGDDERSILGAMAGSNYIARSFSGISADTGLDKDKADAAISSLVSQGLVRQIKSREGGLRFSLTGSGRALHDPANLEKVLTTK